MEGVHGVDVSWLHNTNRDANQKKAASPNGSAERSPKVKDNSASSTPNKPTIRKVPSEAFKGPAQQHVTPPSLSEAKRDITPAVSSISNPQASPTSNGHSRAQSSSKRPQMSSRTSSEKPADEGTKNASRRPGWINNLSSKFSSQSTPTRASQSANLPLRSPPLSGPVSTPTTGTEAVEAAEPYVPSKPKESGSFFSSLSRRLSSTSQTSNNSRLPTTGAICPRKVLNLNPNRERCLVPELESKRLRKVSFCVDVEIAGGPKYKDAPDDDAERLRKKKEAKIRERAEGEALKNPEAQRDEEAKSGDVMDAGRTRSTSLSAPKAITQSKELDDDDNQEGMPRDSMDESSLNRKKEKKKRSEAERKERKEQRTRRAQESGQLPVEIGGDDEDDEDESAPNETTASKANATAMKMPRNDRPTTDPARIYRRCCQLRETPILKRITEQLMSPKSMLPNEPGVVSCLDLTGSRMQLPDVVALGDWLAVVPVKRLLLEDADLNDEAVRCVLAGLLAAKRPEPTKRKFTNPRHRDGLGPAIRYQERSGIIEKVTLKNNPRISRVGWKHISLFIYMCRSIKAIDTSMNKFPDTVPASSSSPKTPQESTAAASRDVDAAEILFKCLAERLGGNRLEELSMSECALKASHIRKIVDGAMICGISRLGLAGNNLNDAGLDHVMHYLKSGICHGIDLGGNNLKGKLDRIADSLIAKPDNPCWGLSLADCGLDAESVKPLFSALIQLPNFRFVDFSHNRSLCSTKEAKYNIITLLRRYIPQMKNLKRIHLNDVNMTPNQAIALAEVLPEGPRLAHVSVLENPQLSALANNTDEASQEDACALYASFMMAVRCSHTLICIDIDVPSQETSEVVKALAKQVVAYSLRNMEDFAIAEFTGESASTDAAARLIAPHAGEKGIKKMSYPDVLMHLVGHVDGIPENHDNDDPAPDDDYIVGGTGVVKALQYVLGEKANDLRRTSVPGSPISGPQRSRPGSSAGLDQMGKVKAKQMSRSLLDTARKIRQRLHPAIMKESTAGDEMAYRRLQYLDNTLQSMIARFEEEFPETRMMNDGTAQQTSVFLDISRRDVETRRVEDEMPPELDLAADEDEDDSEMQPGVFRRNSDASMASRSMTLEEGRLHRLGQALRRDIINTSSPVTAPEENAKTASDKLQGEKDRIRALAEKIESTPGEVLKPMVDNYGWAAVLKQWGANYEDVRAMQEQDPEGWEQFTDAQMKAKMNLDRNRPKQPGPNMF